MDRPTRSSHHPASRYAVIGVAASVSISAGSCTGAAVAVGGLVPTPCRAASVEQALTGQVLTPDVIATASQAVSNDVGDDPLGDIFASGEYRKAVAHVYVGRAVAAAAERAAGA